MGVFAKLLIIIMSIFDALREMIRDEIEDIKILFTPDEPGPATQWILHGRLNGHPTYQKAPQYQPVRPQAQSPAKPAAAASAEKPAPAPAVAPAEKPAAPVAAAPATEPVKKEE